MKLIFFLQQKASFPLRPKGDCIKNRQEGLAEALEVSRQTIGSLENGRYNPSILLACKIPHYFGMSIEEIFIYEEEPS